MEEIVQELQKISEILLQNQTPAWLTYLSSLGPLILTGISVFIACRQHKQNRNLQKQIANRDSSNLLRQNVLEVYNAYFNGSLYNSGSMNSKEHTRCWLAPIIRPN